MQFVPMFITLAAAPLTASASVVPFTEDFETGSSNWVAGSFAPLAWNATGGLDGSAYVTSTTDLNTAGPFGLALLRGQDDQDSSNDAFVGNYLTSGITTVSFDIRHNAGIDLDISLRVAGSGNFPAFAVQTGGLVASGQWMTLTFDLSFSNPLVTIEGPPSQAAFDAVMQQVGNLQVATFRPDGLMTPLLVDVDLDNFTIVPSPGGMAILGLGLLGVARRRRG